MVAVAARNDGSNGNGCDRMSGREAAAHVRDIVEESVRIVPSTGDVLWTPSVRHAVHYGAEHFGIGNRFCSEERGLLHIGVAEVKAGDIKRRGDGDCFRGGYVTAERPIKAAKSCCVIEIGVDV